MSAVSAFAKAAGSKSFALIGTQTLSIAGGTSIACVINDARDTSELVEFGQDPTTAQDCVVSREVFDAAYPLDSQSYNKKTAVAAGRTMRVSGINRGRDFVTITLAGKEKA